MILNLVPLRRLSLLHRSMWTTSSLTSFSSKTTTRYRQVLQRRTQQCTFFTCRFNSYERLARPILRSTPQSPRLCEGRASGYRGTSFNLEHQLHCDQVSLQDELSYLVRDSNTARS